MSRWDAVRAFWEADIVARGKEPELLLILAFLLSFGAVRFVTHSIRNDWLPMFGNVHAGGVHIHHMVPGMLLVLVAGFFGLAMGENRPTRLLAVLFGIGAALVLDEFALWLWLADVYWTEQGQRSIEAVIVAAALGALYVAGLDFLRHVGLLLLGRFRRVPASARRAAPARPRCHAAPARPPCRPAPLAAWRRGGRAALAEHAAVTAEAGRADAGCRVYGAARRSRQPPLSAQRSPLSTPPCTA